MQMENIPSDINLKMVTKKSADRSNMELSVFLNDFLAHLHFQFIRYNNLIVYLFVFLTILMLIEEKKAHAAEDAKFTKLNRS